MASSISAGTTSSTALVATADTSGALQLATNNGTVAVTIDTSQNVGIGTTTPSYRVDAVGAGSPANGIMRTSSNLTNSTTKYGYYTVGHYTNATAPFGFIQGESNSTENNVHIGGGAGEVTAATRIDFYTAANNTTTNGTERMRISSAGRVSINTTYADTQLNIAYNGSSIRGVDINNTVSGNQDAIYFRTNGTNVGRINTDASNTSYVTSSDYRLKENITPMTGGLSKVALLKPVTYKWKVNGSDGQGFIAHELAEVVPDCVTGEKDAVETYTDEDGNEQTRIKPQGIDTSFLVATLTAAIQEQQALITSLTARIAALEGTPA